MPSLTRMGGWNHAGNGIGSLIHAIAQAPLARAQAEQAAALNNAKTYAANMQGNLHGAKARGLEITNNYRTAPLDTGLPAHMQEVQRVFQWGGGNADQLASAAQRFRQIFLSDEAKANPNLAPAIGQAQAAAAGKQMYNNVGNTGAVVNPYTGVTQIANPQMFGVHSDVEKSKALENMAQANAHNALADVRAQDVVQKIAEAEMANIDLRRAQQGLPPIKSSHAASAAESRGLAQVISSVISDPNIPQEEKEAMIEEYAGIFNRVMGNRQPAVPQPVREAKADTQHSGNAGKLSLFARRAVDEAIAAQNAMQQMAVLPNPQVQQAAPKTITLQQIMEIAKMRGVSPDDVTNRLAQQGYQVQ